MNYSADMAKDDQITRGWSEFVRESIGGLSNREVAERIGVSDSTVGNWVRGDNFKQPDGRSVVRFAREFGRPLAAALVAAGYGDESEYNETVLTIRDTASLSYDELVELAANTVTELRRRTMRADPNEPPL